MPMFGRSIAIGGSFIAIVIVLSAVIFYFSLGPCPQGTYACDNATKCVPQRQICDNRYDCLDMSDEHPVECGLLYGSKEMTDKIIGNAIEKHRQKPNEIMKLMNNSTIADNNNSISKLKDVITINSATGEEASQQNQIYRNESENRKENIKIINMNSGAIKTNNNLNNYNKNNNYVGNVNSNNVNVMRNYNACEISTYPKQCTCRLLTILYCGRSTASRLRLTKIGPEVTNLMISRNNLTLRENTFSHLKQLQRLALKNNNISQLPHGTFNGLEQLQRFDFRYNNLSTILPHGILRGLPKLEWLFLASNRLNYLPLNVLNDVPRLQWLVLTDNLLTLRNDKFPAMKALYEIYLDSNLIEHIDEETFSQLNSLHLLDLSHNRIAFIHAKAFWGLRAIRDIRLTGNPIKELAAETFFKNLKLEALSLGHTPLHVQKHWMHYLNVSFLNLTGIKFEHIDFKAVNKLSILNYVVFDRFYFCSMVPEVRNCKPNTDGVSSFSDLLSKPVLRYSAWIMGMITVLGNLLVLWGRFIYRDENITVTMVIRNLALADILMGFYLLTIGVQDLRFRDEYHKVALDWLTSWQCVFIGTLAVSSSEVSMLILAFMSLERFLLIANPFRGHHRISSRTIFIALLVIWTTGVGIAVAPVALFHTSTKFYGTHSGTCFPLHIQEAYPLGWEYSAFMFLGVNLMLLLMIALLYTALLISIWQTRRATPLSLLDCEFAVRFFFIVLTDVLCWAPIICMKIWVFFNYSISDDIYAWLVVFILPLNSAVNPLLYTFTTPKYRNQILLRGWKKITARRRAEPSNGLMATTTIGTATASSNPEEMSGKVLPLVVNQ